jgi:glutathione S-transferase
MAARCGSARDRAVLCLRNAFRLSRPARPAGDGFRPQKTIARTARETKKQIARIIAAWESALDTYKSKFLFGELSVADCMYAPVVSRFETFGVAVPASVRAYMDRVIALPAMREWHAASQKEVEAGIG